MGGVDKANQMNGNTADGMANQTRAANRAHDANGANGANAANRANDANAANSTSTGANRANASTAARKPRRRMPHALTGEDAYKDGKLTRPAMVSLVILTFITFVGNFTQLQLTSALPTIVSEFHISVTTGQWLTSVFQLVMGVMVPLTAFLTKRFSTRRIVIVSMVAFTIGSVLGWLADSFVLVLLGRLIEAAGTGVMWPVLQIVVFSVFPVTKRGVAMGTVGLAMSIAPAVGPTLGGWQTDTNGWRSIFLSLAVIGLLGVVAASLWLHDFGEHDETVRTDFLSVVLSVFGFGGLLFGFTNIETYPITHPMCWVPMAVGVVGIAWFVTRQLRREDPLLDLRVLKNRAFTFGTATASLAFFAFSSIFVVIPLFIQDDRGYSATMSGLIMLPGAIGMAISQLFGGRALDRFGARPIVVSGGLILLLGTIGMSMISMTSPMWWVSVCQLVRQIGMGFVLMPVTTWSLNCLTAKDVSAGSAVTNTMRQIAGAVGSPVLVIAMESFARMWQRHGMGAVEASVWGIKCSLWMSSAITFAMVVCIFVGVRGEGAGSGREMSLRALRRRRRR